MLFHEIQSSVKLKDEIKTLNRLKQKHTSVFCKFVLHPPVETLTCDTARELFHS